MKQFSSLFRSHGEMINFFFFLCLHNFLHSTHHGVSHVTKIYIYFCCRYFCSVVLFILCEPTKRKWIFFFVFRREMCLVLLITDFVKFQVITIWSTFCFVLLFTHPLRDVVCMFHFCCCGAVICFVVEMLRSFSFRFYFLRIFFFVYFSVLAFSFFGCFSSLGTIFFYYFMFTHTHIDAKFTFASVRRMLLSLFSLWSFRCRRHRHSK